MAKITAPNRAYKGISAGVVFKDGVGETDDPGALAYFRRAGYEVSGKADGEFPTATVTEAPEHVWTPETPASVPFGTPLRDAAVAPLPKDFLPPTNAGLADPHSGMVVSPGLHGVTPGALVPGPVEVDNVKAQEAVETAVAAAVLVNDQQAPEIPAIADAARSEAGVPTTAEAKAPPSDRPKAGDKKDEWVAYAVRRGMTTDDAEAATKAELIEKYAGT